MRLKKIILYCTFLSISLVCLEVNVGKKEVCLSSGFSAKLYFLLHSHFFNIFIYCLLDQLLFFFVTKLKIPYTKREKQASVSFVGVLWVLWVFLLLERAFQTVS